MNEEIIEYPIDEKIEEYPIEETKSLSPLKFSMVAPVSEEQTITPTDIITGLYPLKAMRSINAMVAEKGVPAMKTIPLLKNIPFGARFTGDPNAIIDLMTAVSSPGKEVLKTGLKRAPEIMGKDYTITRAKTLAQDLKDLRTGYGTLKQDMIDQVGNVKVDAPKLYKTLAKLPDIVTKKFEDIMYGVERSGKGAFKNNIQNVDRMREAIGDLLSSADWIEASRMSKGVLKNTFNELGNLMKKASPEVSPALDAYFNFMKDIYRPAEKVLFKGGKVVEKPLRGALTKGAERTIQQAIEGLSKSVETSKQALKDMLKFEGRQQTKKTIGGLTRRFLPYAILGGGAYGLGRMGR